jgi:hypothetical protein
MNWHIRDNYIKFCLLIQCTASEIFMYCAYIQLYSAIICSYYATSDNSGIKISIRIELWVFFVPFSLNYSPLSRNIIIFVTTVIIKSCPKKKSVEWCVEMDGGLCTSKNGTQIIAA